MSCINLLAPAGMKLEKGQQYTVTFPKTLHMTHAVLSLESIGSTYVYFDCFLEVRAIVDGQDHILCVLGGYGGAREGCAPEMQRKLDLKFAQGKPVQLYTKVQAVPYLFNLTIGGTRLRDAPVAVQITGYFE